jgi:hypothetical protein
MKRRRHGNHKEVNTRIKTCNMLGLLNHLYYKDEINEINQACIGRLRKEAEAWMI